MAFNINSSTECMRLYIDYHCYGNRLGTTAEQMGQITQKWQGLLPSWQASMANDENEYEFDDTEFMMYWDKGTDIAKDKANGYDGRTVGDNAHTIGGIAASSAGFAVQSPSIIKGGVKAVKFVGKTVGKIFKKGGEKAVEEGAKKAGGKALGKWSAYAGAALTIAAAARYMASKPNEDGLEAANVMLNEMGNAEMALMASQDEMTAISEEIIELSDEAVKVQEETNSDIEDQKTDFDLYMATIQALQAKVDAGEPLTDEEKALYEKFIGYLSETDSNIQGAQKEAEVVFEDTSADIENYQSDYDYQAETIGEVQGLTDYAESFDEATKKACNVEGVAQGMNAVTGAVSGARLLAGGFWNWALGLTSIAAGIRCGFASKEQFTWGKEIKGEIQAREMVQELNIETEDIYIEEIDNFDATMTSVDELEVLIPNDIEAPSDTAIPVATGSEKPEESDDDTKKKDIK